MLCKLYFCQNMTTTFIKHAKQIFIVPTKIGNAQQVRINNNYRNTKLKLLKANATIWFNKDF